MILYLMYVKFTINKLHYGNKTFLKPRHLNQYQRHESNNKTFK